MMMLVSGIIGIAMMVGFLGFLVWWIRDLPFTIIVVVVVLLLLYDFVRTLRYGDGGARR
jgi:membrane protein implicated in regulation of membrane protease activity